MKKILIGIAFMLELTAMAQTGRPKGTSLPAGIHFSEGLTWKQIVEKAKLENKFVFVDCYASWCSPCKEMDRLVYIDEKVGTYFNQKFISVRLQMDKTSKDNDAVKLLYNDADAFDKKYKISSFPTYLFFSPYGKLLHRYGGAMSPANFILVGSDAITPEKQYFTLLENFHLGVRNYDAIGYMIGVAQVIGDVYSAKLLSNEYLKSWLLKQPDSVILRKENLELAGQCVNLVSTKDKIFSLYYRQPGKVDKVMGKGYAQALADFVIENEELTPKLYADGKPSMEKPDWNLLAKGIANKFTKGDAERVILKAQIAWYEQQKNYTEFIKYSIKQKEKYGLDTIGIAKVMINNFVYNMIFKHSNDRRTLSKGIEWMEMLIKLEPNTHEWLDTYANLLYKVGRKEEAIKWEKKAIQVVENKKRDITSRTQTMANREAVEVDDNVIKRLENSIEEYKRVMGKISKGMPTWTE